MTSQRTAPNPSGRPTDLGFYRRQAINRSGCLSNMEVGAGRSCLAGLQGGVGGWSACPAASSPSYCSAGPCSPLSSMVWNASCAASWAAVPDPTRWWSRAGRHACCTSPAVRTTTSRTSWAPAAPTLQVGHEAAGHSSKRKVRRLAAGGDPLNSDISSQRVRNATVHN